MADHLRVQVYLRAEETRRLRAQGEVDPAGWVRRMVKEALGRAGDDGLPSQGETPEVTPRPPEHAEAPGDDVEEPKFPEAEAQGPVDDIPPPPERSFRTDFKK